MKPLPFLKYLCALSAGFFDIARYIYQGFRHGLGLAHLKRFATLTVSYMSHLSYALKEEWQGLSDFDGPIQRKLHHTTRGLHQLLPPDSRFTYSILIPTPGNTNPKFFKTALKAALNQTAPSLEVLIGFNTSPSKEILHLVNDLKASHPQGSKCLVFDRSSLVESTNATLNHLAEKATGHFLLVLHPEDWIRPDLLFRYEQTLRLLPSPETAVLYCNEYQINTSNHPIPETHLNKPASPCFPYLFSDDIGNGLLIPKVLWNRAGGMPHSHRAAYALSLSLDLAGALFHHVPIFLYASRAHSSPLPFSPSSEDASIQALQAYLKAKNFDWEVSSGYMAGTYRAMPSITKASIHVIIPFREQKALTLAAIKSALQQEGVSIKITAIDNGSSDLTIAQELRALGVEVLTLDEPFNYSRLNNLAVQKTDVGKECTHLLFLNNDVILEKDAVAEMSRWVDLPLIGMVGCRLHYPDGSLQHGGVELYPRGPMTRMNWKHTERFKPFKAMHATKKIRITPAVTAACAMVRRQTFLEVGGFDEVWYPIAYSDTNLAVKLAWKGLWCLYTPYAIGVHHESVSRSNDNIEDYENSSWLHQRYAATIMGQSHDQTRAP